MEGTAMNIKIRQKDILGYLFLLLLAAACIVVGARVLHNHHVTSGIFGLILGVVLIVACASMVLRKE
jgi:uncharacterized membrane protein YfcA